MGNDDMLLNELQLLRKDLCRITLASYAIADELHMIRRALEGQKGEYEDPICNTFTAYGLEELIEPV